ncbi:hypothetical protein D3C86_1882870 [compost metagenome]
MAPWPPLPSITRENSSVLAMTGPERIPTVPTGWLFQTCRPMAASTLGFSITPASIMGLAPPGPSSAGWKTSLTVPENSCLRSLRILATPRRMAMWASWPQACITPSCSDLYSWVESS